MPDIWSFTCPVCKSFSSVGSPYRLNNRIRWVCSNCQKKLKKEKKAREQEREDLVNYIEERRKQSKQTGGIKK